MTNQARRFTAAQLELMASCVLQRYKGAVDNQLDDSVIHALRQAASTEAQVAGLVEALEDVLKFSNDPAVIRMTREALSKFRGEDHADS